MELLGHEAAWAEFTAARSAGRLHHAWLLAGPRGMGKRHFADAVARCLLGGGSAGSLVDAGSHPDLRVLAPDPEKPGSGIGVDAVRSLSPLLRSHAAMGGYRVAIVDSADDLNVNAANALLKGLEEPGARMVFLLVAHVPGRLPATIRSRCRVLRFRPLGAPALRALLEAEHPGLDPQERERVIALSGGAPGEALRLAQAGAGSLLRALEGEAAEQLAERLGSRGRGEDYALLCALAPRLAARAVRACPTSGNLETLEKLCTLARDALRPGEDRAQMAHALALLVQRLASKAKA